MSQATEKLSVVEKGGYACGDVASNLFWMTFIYFQSYFYTDVFGLSTAVAGTMFLVARWWDAVNDPIMGMIADRTDTRWGKYRPYLIWMVIPFALTGVLCFTTPDWSESNKIIYAFVTYILVGMAYTAINIPYSSLMGVISPDTHQRTSVSSYRFIGAYTGGLLVLLGTKKLVSVLGGGSEQTGYQATMGLYAAIAVVLFVVTFYTTKERVKPSKQQETSFMKDLRDVVTNGPWLVLFLLGIFTLSYVSIRNGSIMYYFKYVVADSRELLGFDLATWFMVSGSLATIVGTALTAPVARRVGKKQLYLALMGLSGILTIAFYFTGPRDYLAMFSLQVAMNFFMGPTAALVFAMFADAADYAEWKNRRRSTGLVFAASAFAQKMGWTVGGATAMFLLGAFGYEANVVQTEEAVMGLKLLMSIIPAVGAVLAAVVIFLYKLDDKFMKQIEEELEARRREAGEQPAEA